ncbi:MAG: CHAP domain-containing protein [Solirubrobacteraceae bacterium]
MVARSTAVAATLACLLAAAFSVSASASTLSQRSLWAGGRAYLAMDLGAPASSCQLVASGPQQTRQILNAVTPSRRRVAWIWTVPVRARTARWRVSATCGSSRLRVSFAVHGKHQKSILALARQVRVYQSGGALPAPAAAASASPPASSSPPTPSFPQASAAELGAAQGQAKAWWVENGASVLSTFHAGISMGQCTDYAAEMRQDVVQSVDTWAYTGFLLAHRDGDLGIDWTAKNWLINAQSVGMATGHLPEAGAVMVFQPGAYGAYSSGHVAIVTSVHADRSFTISEMHAPLVGQLTTRNFSTVDALAMVLDPAIGFIYR